MPGQRLVEGREQLGGPVAYLTGQLAALIEVYRFLPAPDVAHLDAGAQVGVSSAEALEERIEPLVVLRSGVLALPKPWPLGSDRAGVGPTRAVPALLPAHHRRVARLPLTTRNDFADPLETAVARAPLTRAAASRRLCVGDCT